MTFLNSKWFKTFIKYVAIFAVGAASFWTLALLAFLVSTHPLIGTTILCGIAALVIYWVWDV